MSQSSTQIIAYIPVIHRGYLKFLHAHPEAKQLWLLPKEYTKTFRFLEKDMRSLEPVEIVTSLTALNVPQKVSVLDMNKVDLLTRIGGRQLLKSTQAQHEKNAIQGFLLPDEEISHVFADEFLRGQKIEFAPIFLRWDTSRSLASQEIRPDEEISHQEFDQKIMQSAQALAQKSLDWWRQVGAVLVRNRPNRSNETQNQQEVDPRILFQAYNSHVPHPQEPYIVGDPRANFHKGEHIEKSTALHAEAAVIAQAAKEGVALDGASLYVTTFPCPYCAKLIAASAISTLYYQTGYSMIDGAEVMKKAGVRIVRVTDV